MLSSAGFFCVRSLKKSLQSSNRNLFHLIERDLIAAPRTLSPLA